jgi:Tfp pilus assembly protein PilF
LVAVAAAAALVFAAVLAGYSVGRQHGRVEAALDRSALESAGSQLSLAALDVGTYQVARDQLLSALEDRRASISTDTLRVVEENLGVIDQAIVRITAALSKNPNNPQLTHRLASVYRQQIELLQRATRLPDET